MTFASPAFLLALLLVPAAAIAYLLVQRRRSRYVVRFTNVDLLANLVPRSPGWRRHVPTALYLAAVAALGIALARPSMTLAVPREEATVVLTMDVSRSMTATDVAPDRLSAAKRAATDFLDQLPDTFQVALVAFSSEARLVVAPTTDRAPVRAAVAALSADGGTALGDAIALSVQAAQSVQASGAGGSKTPVAPGSGAPGPSATPGAAASPGPSASPGTASDAEPPLVATVLLSDGANSTGRLEPLDAAGLAAAAGMPIYTIALGTADGVVDVPDRSGTLVPLNVPPDPETLASIAEMTGGRAFEAPTSKDLAAIYQSLGSKVGSVERQEEVTQWFAAGALVLVLVGGGLAALWFNRLP